MNLNYQISYEAVVETDPTLKYLITDTKFDFDKLEHQVNLRCAAIVLAISKWIDINYK